MLLKDVPKQCPKCDTSLFASVPKPAISRKAISIALAGIPITGIWVLLFLLFSPVYVVPRGLYGVVTAFVVYAWPLCLTVIYAMRLPDVVKARCYKCRWSDVFPIETPKVSRSGPKPPPLK